MRKKTEQNKIKIKNKSQKLNEESIYQTQDFTRRRGIQNYGIRVLCFDMGIVFILLFLFYSVVLIHYFFFTLFHFFYFVFFLDLFIPLLFPSIFPLFFVSIHSAIIVLIFFDVNYLFSFSFFLFSCMTDSVRR